MGSDSKPKIGYSMDGGSWVEVNININGAWGTLNSVAYNNNMWVSVGAQVSDALIVTSTDGKNWNINNFYSPSTLNEVCYGNSLWVIVGNGRDPFTGWSIANIITSVDGLNWKESYRHNTSNTFFSGVAYNKFNGTWVACGGGNLICYSKNGKDWQKSNTNINGHESFIKVSVINSEFVVTAVSWNNLLYSSNGINWNSRPITSQIMSNPFKVILYNGKLIAGGLGKYQIVYSVNNGDSWGGNLDSFNTLNITNYIATDNDMVIAVGYDRKTYSNTHGQILNSYDGINWKSNLISFITNIQCIASNIPL
jgi:hypothetical protein